MQCLLNILRKQINFSQFSWDYYSKLMTQDVLFAGGAAEKPPQIPEECFCRETTVLCDDPDPCVRVLRSLGQEDPLDDGMATHSSILAWRMPVDRGAWQATVHGVAKSWTQEAT